MINVPCSYPYNPKPMMLALAGLLFGGASFFFANEAMHNDRGLIIEHMITLDTNGGTIFYWTFAGLSALFVLMAIASGLRTLLSPKVLRLDVDSISLPHGLLHRFCTRVQYSSISSLSENQVQSQRMLYVHTREKKYVIHRSWLPTNQIYDEIRDFLKEQVERH